MDRAWREVFPKERKPAYAELLAFFPADVRALFLRFDGEMNAAYRVCNKWQRFEKSAGWVYGYCRNYRCELLSVSVGDSCFRVLGVDVCDEPSLQRALQTAKEAYERGYEERYAQLVAGKKASQLERAKLRQAREKEELARLCETTDPAKLNRFRWPPKASRRDLVRLYRGEAQGVLDEELLDEIGYTFYTRCKQGGEIRALMDKGRLVCHHCGALLSPTGYASVTPCACGYAYTYREYRRSCNAASMPGGRAAPLFHRFAQKWPGCKNSGDKMLLIDWLIHECHVTVMSGEKGRSVCMNLIEGTHAQIKEMLEALAGHP